MVIPLATLVLSTIYVYNAREFTELLLAQPFGDRRSSPVSISGSRFRRPAAFLVGVGLPFCVRAGGEAPQYGAVAALLLVGVALTFVFTAIAFCIALRRRRSPAGRRVRAWRVAVGRRCCTTDSY